MGGICSKIVYSAKDYVLEQPYISQKQFLCTSKRDDVVVDLDSGYDGIVASQITLFQFGDKKLVDSEKSKLHVAQRLKMADVEGNVRIFSIKDIVDGVQITGEWPSCLTFVAGDSIKARFLQMRLSNDEMDKSDILGDGRKFYFIPMRVKREMSVQSNGYFEESSDRYIIWYGAEMDRSRKLLLKDDPAYPGRHRLCQLKHCNPIFSIHQLSDVAFLDDLVEEIWSYNLLAFKATGNNDRWLYSLLNQCSIPIVDAVFIFCALQCSFFAEPGQALGQSNETKSISVRNALDSVNLFYLLASGFSFIGSVYTRENFELWLELPFCKTITGTSRKLHIEDTCMISLNTVIGPYSDQCISYESESVKSFLLKTLWVSEFQEKPQSEQEDILIYIYTNWQVLHQDSVVIEALKDTTFVTSADGDLYKPKDLFDPGDSLLISVFSGEVHRFPGKKFTSDRWLDILRKTGLQNTSDADIVLECAKRVELLGAKSMSPLGLDDNDDKEYSLEVSIEICSLAETLVTAIFENFFVLFGNKFCNILGKIACIPAKRGFPLESGKKGCKRVLCSYSEAILLKDWRLAWSVAPVLFRESLVPPEYSWEALQLRSPPPFPTVLKHLQDEINTDSTFLNTEESTFKLFKYLDCIWDTLSSSDILELKQVAFVAADNGTRLVTCSSLFAHLSKNLSPLASKIPPHYLPFIKILRELGSEDRLCISTAMNILLGLQNSYGYHRLNPNELHAVIEILHFLCNETIDQQTSDRPTWQSELVVPDDGCRLVLADSSVYIDRYGSQYVKFIDSLKLRFVHRDVSERLCLAFGIRKLSDVVVEELDCVELLQTREEFGSVSLSAIKKKLLSRSFHVAVSRILYTVSSSTIGSVNPDFQTIQKSLNFVAKRLQFVQCIYTRFWLFPKFIDITHVSKESIIPEWGSGSSHLALYYVDRSNTCILIAEPPSYVSVIDLVSIVVSIVLGSPVPLPIGSLFQCLKESETALVDILKLSSDNRVMDSVGRGIGFLGRELLPQDEDKVYFSHRRPFYKGEIVAWVSIKGEKPKYGRIPEDVRPPERKTFYTFNLETFPGKIETIDSSLVYYFISFSVDERYVTGVRSEDGDHVVNSMPIEQPDQPAKVKVWNQEPPVKQLEYTRVSAEELVFAVEEMLSHPVIGMDTEKQHLLLTTLSLQQRLKESQEALLLEQEKSEMGTKEADEAKAALQCQICLSNEIDITLVPCGHVMCSPCSSSISCCPICGIQLSETIKIYRP